MLTFGLVCVIGNADIGLMWPHWKCRYWAQFGFLLSTAVRLQPNVQIVVVTDWSIIFLEHYVFISRNA